MDEFPVDDGGPIDDANRDAAVAHLVDEHARGAFDLAELQRRTEAVRAATTVAGLLAATAEAPSVTTTATDPVRQPLVRNSVLALVAGLLVAFLLGAVVISRLG
jgi:hypothetical protein